MQFKESVNIELEKHYNNLCDLEEFELAKYVINNFVKEK